MHVSKARFCTQVIIEKTYLVDVGVVQVLPIYQRISASSELLHLFGGGSECLPRKYFGLFSFDCNIKEEHNSVVLYEIKTQDVTTTFLAMLGKKGRNGLEHALGNEVLVGCGRLPCVDKLGVGIDNVLEYDRVVLESHSEPDITNVVSLIPL